MTKHVIAVISHLDFRLVVKSVSVQLRHHCVCSATVSRCTEHRWTIVNIQTVVCAKCARNKPFRFESIEANGVTTVRWGV